MVRARIKMLIVADPLPNFAKIGPLAKQPNQRQELSQQFRYPLIHTGQHQDTAMSDVFFKELGISEPDIDLGSGAYAKQPSNIMVKFEPLYEKESPGRLVVVGNLKSTMACATPCSRLETKEAFVGSGRCGNNRRMPNEMSCIVNDSMDDLLPTPSEYAAKNLTRESVSTHQIMLVKKTMINAPFDNFNTERPLAISKDLTILKEPATNMEGNSGSNSSIGQAPPLWDGLTTERAIHSIAKAI